MINRKSSRLRRSGSASAVDLPADVGSIDIGTQVRQMRKARGLSLQELADKMKVSIGYLSQVERNLSRLTIDGLVQIGDALGVPMHWFFQQAGAPQAERDLIVRAQRRRRMDYPGLGVTEELLSPTLAAPIEMLLSTFQPGAESGGKPYKHAGFEAGTVIEGTLELWVDDQAFKLATGDSFAFESKRMHRFRNPGKSVARVIWVMTPPSY